jgi:hypothetical protein
MGLRSVDFAGVLLFLELDSLKERVGLDGPEKTRVSLNCGFGRRFLGPTPGPKFVRRRVVDVYQYFVGDRLIVSVGGFGGGDLAEVFNPFSQFAVCRRPCRVIDFLLGAADLTKEVQTFTQEFGGRLC